MKIHIAFKVLNPDFDIDYAKRYQAGKESVGNSRYLMKHISEIHDVRGVELVKNAIFHLTVKLSNNRELNARLPKMSIFRFTLSGGKVIEFAASCSVVRRTQILHNKRYAVMRCYFYINATPEGLLLVETAFIAEHELPLELKNVLG